MTVKRSDRYVEFAAGTKGFRYRLGLSVTAWCMGVLTALMFWPGGTTKNETLNLVVTPVSTLLGAVVLGLLGIKGYQDWTKSSWSRRGDYDWSHRRGEEHGDGDKDDDRSGRAE